MNQAQAIAAAGYDLDALLDEAAGQVTFNVPVISDADGNPVSGFIIVSRNSPEYKAADRAVNIANRKASATRTKAIDMKTDEGAGKVDDIVSDQVLCRAAAVVVGWFGWTAGGQPRPFDKAKVMPILKQMPTWVEKINVAMAEDANFLPILRVSSADTPSSSSN